MKDVLGRTVKVGDTVLTTAYYSVSMNKVTKVEIVKPTYVVVTIPYEHWRYDEVLSRNVPIVIPKKMSRKSYQVLVIDDQLKQNEHIGEPYVSPYDLP